MGGKTISYEVSGISVSGFMIKVLCLGMPNHYPKAILGMMQFAFVRFFGIDNFRICILASNVDQCMHGGIFACSRNC